jgi:Mg-chelatase subunit ChlD
MRAHAVLRGAERVQVKDLRALRSMMGRRIPPEAFEQLEAITEEIVRASEEESTELQAPSGGAQPAPSWLDPGELPQAAAETQPGASEVEQAAEIELDEDTEDAELVVTPERPADVEDLLRAFVGRIERGRSDPDHDPGGQPRSYRPLQRLDELMDGDLVEALLFTEARLPGQPRTYRRTRRNAGGAVVILRDVSSSMAGQRNAWAGQVVAGLVKVAARRRMRVGYIEFHHRALPREVAGRLLHRVYPKLFEFAASAHPLGQTNYEEPLSMALESLRGRRGRNRHVVMLTDGLPITGDTRVQRERRLAHQLGVSLHTVFIGDGACPVVLDDISRETQGLRFQARPSGHGLRVEERA